MKRRLFSSSVLAATAALSSALSVLTLAWPDWIERAFAVDPDAGDGSLELVLTAAFLALAMTLTTLAIRSSRRAQVQMPTTNIR